MSELKEIVIALLKYATLRTYERSGLVLLVHDPGSRRKAKSPPSRTTLPHVSLGFQELHRRKSRFVVNCVYPTAHYQPKSVHT